MPDKGGKLTRRNCAAFHRISRVSKQGQEGRSRSIAETRIIGATLRQHQSALDACRILPFGALPDGGHGKGHLACPAREQGGLEFCGVGLHPCGPTNQPDTAKPCHRPECTNDPSESWRLNSRPRSGYPCRPMQQRPMQARLAHRRSPSHSGSSANKNSIEERFRQSRQACGSWKAYETETAKSLFHRPFSRREGPEKLNRTPTGGVALRKSPLRSERSMVA